MLFAAVTVLLAGCPQYSQRYSETKDQDFLNTFLFLQYQSQGSCLVAEKKSGGQLLLHCIEAPRTSCRADGLFDPFGNRFITDADTSARYIAEISELKDQFPECETAAGIAASGLQVTSEADQETIRQNTKYTVIESCAEIKLADGLSRSDYDYFRSARGRLLLAAVQSSQTECSHLIADESRRKQASDLAGLSKTVFDTCIYSGTLPGTTACPAETEPFEADFP